MGTVAETWRRVWGDGQIFRGPKFLNDFFSEKISIFTLKNSDDLLLLVIDQVFQIFTLFFRFLRSLLCKMSYMTLSSQEKHYFRKEFLDDTYFLLCSCFRAHPTTLLLKILGGPMHGPSPTSNFGGTVPQSP